MAPSHAIGWFGPSVWLIQFSSEKYKWHRGQGAGSAAIGPTLSSTPASVDGSPLSTPLALCLFEKSRPTPFTSCAYLPWHGDGLGMGWGARHPLAWPWGNSPKRPPFGGEKEEKSLRGDLEGERGPEEAWYCLLVLQTSLPEDPGGKKYHPLVFHCPEGMKLCEPIL